MSYVPQCKRCFKNGLVTTLRATGLYNQTIMLNIELQRIASQLSAKLHVLGSWGSRHTPHDNFQAADPLVGDKHGLAHALMILQECTGFLRAQHDAPVWTYTCHTIATPQKKTARPLNCFTKRCSQSASFNAPKLTLLMLIGPCTSSQKMVQCGKAKDKVFQSVSKCFRFWFPNLSCAFHSSFH